MEAVLQERYGVDLRDLWRSGGRLTYRRLWALVANAHIWTLEAHLMDDVRRQIQALGGVKNPKPYPGRFDERRRQSDTPEFRQRRRQAMQRKRERERRIKAGEIT